MFYFILQSIRTFGFINGLFIYFNVKVLHTGTVKFISPSQQLFFRPRSVDIHTFREIFLRQEYNIDLPEKFIPLTIIDAGANIGFTTLYFKRKYPKANILSFEPDNTNFLLLQKNTRNIPDITPIQKALWNKSGFIKISDRGYGVRGFVVEDVSPNAPGTVLPAIAMADIIHEHNLSSIDILKMDIEGSEKEVFEANTSWLAITKCLIIELHDRMKPGCSKAVFAALNNYNFECSIKGENLVFINRDLLS